MFKKINVNINTGVIITFLKPVITHCVLFDYTGNIVDEPVQQQHYFTLTFTYIENVIRLVLFIAILCDDQKFNKNNWNKN